MAHNQASFLLLVLLQAFIRLISPAITFWHKIMPFYNKIPNLTVLLRHSHIQRFSTTKFYVLKHSTFSTNKFFYFVTHSYTHFLSCSFSCNFPSAFYKIILLFSKASNILYTNKNEENKNENIRTERIRTNY